MISTKNANLTQAKKAKNDEFYTQYRDIEKEMNAYLEYDENVFRDKTILLPCDDPEWSNFTLYFAQSFTRLGLKKLISTSYVHPEHNESGDKKGKIFILERDSNADGKIDIEDMTWEYLQGDGDFRSEEIKALRDEADMIITNPPFSLFREFISWIDEGGKQFSVIGNINAVTYKDVFPLIADNKIWIGPTISSGDREFAVPETYPLNAAGCRVDEKGQKYISVKGVRWFTNVEHGRRHEPLMLMTMEDNKRFNKKIVKSETAYLPYDNYKAIEVPFTNAIPSDYDEIMAVPITFLDKYNPEQFEILSSNDYRKNDQVPFKAHGLIKDKDGSINGKPTYVRILIKHKKQD